MNVRTFWLHIICNIIVIILLYHILVQYTTIYILRDPNVSVSRNDHRLCNISASHNIIQNYKKNLLFYNIFLLFIKYFNLTIIFSNKS